VGSFSSIEAEVSSMSTSETDVLVVEIEAPSPSSKTAKSFFVRSVT
jgi:hypothetical protein